MRARAYDPTAGRFVSEDPSMDGHNLFIYAHNRPTVGADASGCENMDFEGLATLIERAWRIFTSGEFSTMTKICKLQEMVKDFERICRINKIISGYEMNQAQLDYETSGLMGDLGAIQRKIAEIKFKIAQWGLAMSGVGQISLEIVQIMITMLINED